MNMIHQTQTHKHGHSESFLPAGHARSARTAGPKIALQLIISMSVYLSVSASTLITCAIAVTRYYATAVY